MNCVIRNANINDFEAVARIMNQVQQMHVEWRPDVYKPNENLIPRDIFGARERNSRERWLASRDGD